MRIYLFAAGLCGALTAMAELHPPLFEEECLSRSEKPALMGAARLVQCVGEGANAGVRPTGSGVRYRARHPRLIVLLKS